MSTKRIAILVPTLIIKGGTHLQLMQLARELKRRDQAADIFTFVYVPDGTFPEFKDLSIKSVLRLGQDSVWLKLMRRFKLQPEAVFLYISLLFKGRFAKLLDQKTGEYTTLNPHDWFTIWVAADAKRRYQPQADIVAMLNDMPPCSFRNSFKDRIVRRLDHGYHSAISSIMVLDNTMKRRAQAYFKHTRVEVVRSGIDLEAYRNLATNRAAARRTMGVAPDDIVLVCASVPTWHRRFEDAIQAVEVIKNPKVKLVIIGSLSHDAPYGELLKKQVADRHLEDRVIFIDSFLPFAERNSYIAASDIFIFPNQNQTWGLGVIEAMALGLPVVVSDGAGVHEVLENDKTALIYPVNNVPKLAKALQSLIDDPDRRIVQATAGKKYALANFSWGKYTDQVLACFETTQSDHPTRSAHETAAPQGHTKNRLRWFNIAVIIGLLALPYYLFHGRLFIGGDDSRLFYVYPWDFLKNIAFFSWFHFSAPGSYGPNQHLLPLLVVLSLLRLIIPSAVVVSYLAYSAPFILGFIFFQKMLREILPDAKQHRPETFAAALFYVLSPILITNQLLIFLYAVWLVALAPIVAYYFLRYYKTGQFRYAFFGALWCSFLALAVVSIPWMAGLLLPLSLGMLLYLAFARRSIPRLIKRGAIFVTTALAAQAFWIIPFLASFLATGTNNAGKQVGSQEVIDTFGPTVLATTHGNTILYPLLNLFHRALAFNFNWSLKNVFLAYYDKLFYANFLFIILFFWVVLQHRTYFKGRERPLYLGLLAAFLASLFFFTVDIGALLNVFLWLGKLPGFVMFRNSYDKFALGYVFIYALMMGLSLIALGRRYPRRRSLIVGVFCAVVLLGFVPVKRVVDEPLSGTTNIQTKITIPAEYTNFMKQVTAQASPSGNILDVPFAYPSYGIIKENGSNNIYAGRSPVQLLTNINDFSGTMSFPSSTSALISQLMITRQYDKLRNLLSLYNVRYIIDTGDIPSAVKRSYLFDPGLLAAQDKVFKKDLYGRQVLASKQGNYRLYELKQDVSQTSTLVGAATELYTAPTDTDNSTDITQQDALLGILNATHTLADTAQAGIPTNVIQQLAVGKNATLPAGDYQLRSDNPHYYTLDYNPTQGTLDLTSGLHYTLAGQAHAAATTTVASATPDLLVKLGDNLMNASDIKSYALNANDTIGFYRKVGDNLLPSAEQMMRTWHATDCNAHDGSGDYNVGNQGDQLQLDATENHNACLYGTVNAQPNAAYRVEFDYNTNAASLSVNLGDGKDVSLSTTPANTWVHYTGSISAGAAGKLAMYIYSGKSNTKAITIYRNLSITQYQADSTLRVSDIAPPSNDSALGIHSNGNETLSLQPPTTALITSNAGQLTSWDRSDCAAIDDSDDATDFTPLDNNGISLIGRRGHNACISHSFSINPNNTYKVTFDYYLKGTSGVQLQTTYPGETPMTHALDTTAQGQWKHFSTEINPADGVGTMQLSLYSGTNPTATANAQYRSLTIMAYPKNYAGNLLVHEQSAPKPAKGITFQIVNQTQANLRVAAAAKPFVLLYNEAFHSGWKLYLKPVNEPALCTKPKTLSNSAAVPVAECPHQSRLVAGDELKLALQKPVFDNHHIQINNYANGWVIDPAYIKQHYSSRYYRQNPDGSLDLAVVAYFQPQSYFYVGLGITGLTLLAGGGILLYRRRSRPHRRRHE